MTNDSPNYHPGATPPPLPGRPTFIGAAFGPLMLLTIGILFAVDYAGGPTVERTWPVLIIEAGVLKLVEFMGDRNMGDHRQ